MLHKQASGQGLSRAPQQSRKGCRTAVFGGFLPKLLMQGQVSIEKRKLARLEIPLQSSTPSRHPFRVCTFNVLVGLPDVTGFFCEAWLPTVAAIAVKATCSSSWVCTGWVNAVC